MLAIADDNFLYLLEFVQQKNLSRALNALQKIFEITEIRSPNSPIKVSSGMTNESVIPAEDFKSECGNPLFKLLKNELQQYFNGTLKTFKTPIKFLGTEFQKLAWQKLQQIPFSTTKSYLEQAQAVGKPLAYRAVANANAVNKIAIIVPCHRIINHNGKMGGYAGGISKKQWLLKHEQKYANS